MFKTMRFYGFHLLENWQGRGAAFRLILSLLVLFCLAAAAPSAHAQAQITDSSVEYSFDEQITFQAVLQSEIPPETAIIFFHAEKDTHTNVNLASIKPLEESTYLLEYKHLLSDYRLRAFATVEYRFEITLKGGEVFKTTTFQFDYNDNRWDWQHLEEPVAPLTASSIRSYHIHWTEGDQVFAQSVLDTAQEGLQNIQSLLRLPPPAKVDIYVYEDPASMQDALGPYTDDWVAGHADPDLGVILVTLPPGPEQQLLMEQRIPHELMHIVLYQSNELGYRYLPTWLSEGLASMVELYPNPDYRIVLEAATENDSLLSISSLCQTFPRDASSALLSYAQSASFVSYLHSTYGASGLQELIKAYANGVDCQRGSEVALGVGLKQLERQWRHDALADNVAATTFVNLLPWLVLLLAILAGPLVLMLYRRPVKSQPPEPSGLHPTD